MTTPKKKQYIRKQETRVMKDLKTGATIVGGLMIGSYILGQLKK